MIKETTSKLHLFYYAYILSFNQFLLYVSLKLISVPRKWSWNHGSLNVFFLPVILICICWDQAAPSPQLFYIVWNNSSEFFLFWESPPSKQIFFLSIWGQRWTLMWTWTAPCVTAQTNGFWRWAWLFNSPRTSEPAPAWLIVDSPT